MAEPQFKVVVPKDVKAGQTVRVRTPDGTEVSVVVPKGLKVGEFFIFDLSTKARKNARQNRSKKPGFLDREIVTMQDFLLALTVGMIIGVGIVGGFLLGVLYATKDVTTLSDYLYQMDNSNTPQNQYLAQTRQQQQNSVVLNPPNPPPAPGSMTESSTSSSPGECEDDEDEEEDDYDECMYSSDNAQ